MLNDLLRINNKIKKQINNYSDTSSELSLDNNNICEFINFNKNLITYNNKSIKYFYLIAKDVS